MSLLTGRTLGRYRLDSLLGQGGMAAVYQASDTKLGRAVAVKVILPSHASDAQFLERFVQEAKVVARLQHRNILPIYDYGDEGGLPYLVMPLLDGGTLRDRMVGKPIPLQQAAEWVRQLADALDAAHEAGILHRDVKPANVLIGKTDLALADFGIAKMLESVSGLTATGTVVGTPIYMAPEQAQGKPATPATDRYALAVLAYELLAGRPPFGGENALALMHQHVTTSAPALSTVVGGLPLGLDAALARGLAKDPAERPPSCRALADSIAAFLPTGALSAVTPTASWSPSTTRDATVLGRHQTPTPTPQVVLTSEVTAPSSPAVAPATRVSASGAAPVGTVRTDDPPSLPGTAATVIAGPVPHAWRLALVVAVVAIVALSAALLLRKPASSPGSREAAPGIRVEPPVAPVEVGGAEHAPPVIPPVVVKNLEDAGARDLAAQVAAAIAANRLVLPAKGSALETLERLKVQHPGSKEAVAAEKELLSVLKLRSAEKIAAKDFEGAMVLLTSAQMLRPQDQAILDSVVQVASLQATSAMEQARAKVPPAPPPPGVAPFPPAGDPSSPRDAPSESTSEDVVGQAFHRLDPSRNGGRRPERADFEWVRATMADLLDRQPNRDELKFLEIYSRGGLAYLAKEDARAGDLVAEAYREGSRNSHKEIRTLALFVRTGDGSFRVPAGWELALSYGDPRREAEGLIAAELARDPRSARALLGRSYLRLLDGRVPDAVVDAIKAQELNRVPQADGVLSEYVADLYTRTGNFPEAASWFGRAATRPGYAGAPLAAFRAAKIYRDKLEDEAQARKYFAIACQGGRREACMEMGEGFSQRGQERRMGRGLKRRRE